MTEIQKKLLELLKEVDAICRRYGVEYYLAGGTLMGAVRHEGFLPWDDDADILMTRDNWKKFIRLYQEGKFPADRALEAADIDRDYPNLFGRYMDTNTTAIHQSQLLDRQPAGMIVDILPLDPVPDDPACMRRYLEDVALYSDLINQYGQYSIRFDCNEERYFTCRKRIDQGFGKLVYGWLKHRLFTYKEEKCALYALRWAGCGMFSEKKIYGKPKDARFEDAVFMIPERPIDYLVWHFGDDWANVPHVEERFSHDAIYHMNRDYREIRGKIAPVILPKKLADAQKKRKEWRLSHAEEIHRMMDHNVAMEAARVSAATEEKLRREPIDLARMVADGEYDRIRAYFKDYITFAASRTAIGRADFDGAYRYYNPVFTKIDPEAFAAVARALVFTGETSKAERLMEVYAQNGGEMTQALSSLGYVIQAIRQAASHYWEGEFPEAERGLAAIPEEYADVLSRIKLRLRLLRREIGDGGDAAETEKKREEFRALLARGQRLYPDDGELDKYAGDLAVLEGKMAEGLLSWYASSKRSANGYIALEIRRFLRKQGKKAAAALTDPAIREMEGLIGFLTWLCERGEQAPMLVCACARLLFEKADDPDVPAGLKKKSLVLAGMEEAYSVAEDGAAYARFFAKAWESLSLTEEDVRARKTYFAARKENRLEAYVREREPGADALSPTEEKLLGDAYRALHRRDKAFSQYRRVLSRTEDPYLTAEIAAATEQTKARMREDLAAGRYPEAVLVHSWNRCFGGEETAAAIREYR